MAKKYEHLRQSPLYEPLCITLQGCHNTGVSYPWALCCRIHLEYISHAMNLSESKSEDKKEYV